MRAFSKLMMLGLIVLLAVPGYSGESDDLFWLTVLHNNDGESQLLNAGSGLEDFGGVSRFARVVRNLRNGAGDRGDDGYGVVTLSSGDNFLAGPEWNASVERGVPFFDSMALTAVRYDAMCIGNHEFDFGPDVLADFIEGFYGPVKFLSANLDVSMEPRLQMLAESGRFAKSTVVRKNGQRIGIIGATTENLPFISSPRFVEVNDVALAVQVEVARLMSRRVNKIILISHLQSIEEDMELASQLSGIDIMIAGGGDELLANDGDLLVPGDEGEVYGPYPMIAMDADGNEVPVVTTKGSYNYVGMLKVGFDRRGRIVEIDEMSRPVRVAGGDNPDAVNPLPALEYLVTMPVAAYLEDLATTMIAGSEVDLDGVRSRVRTEETNQGNLIADSLHWMATELSGDFGTPVPDVALQNGGGIRNDSVIAAGQISELDTYDMVPFSNFVTIIPDIPREQFKEIMENAVSAVEFTSGRYAQVSGFTMVWDPAGTAQELDGGANVVTPGSRVVDITLDDGTVIVSGGVVQPGFDLNVATIDFLARGGDQYPYRGADFTPMGVSYQQALSTYIQDALGGMVTAADYPEGGEGRVMQVVK